MDKHKEVLIDLIEPDFGLLDALLANGLLCNRKYAEVRSLPTVYKRNEQLLTFILPLKTQEMFDRFIEALLLTSQLHVVNFIKKDGVRTEDIGDLWPLSSKQRQNLNRNRFNLVKLIDPDHGLLDVLLSRRVISHRQSEFILSCPPRSEKVEALLEILLRRSTRDLKVTVKCLEEVNQGHVANLLYKNGVTIRIHIKNTEKFENKILPQLCDIISGRSTDERWKILELLQLSNEDIYLVFVEQWASIILFFYCLRCKSLDHLYGLWKSGHLSEIVEKTFRRMTSQEVDLKLELNVVEYERLRKQLSNDEVDLEGQIGIAKPNASCGFEASAVLESTEASSSLERTETEFLRMFSDLDEKVLACTEELRQAFDTQVHLLKEEVAVIKENCLQLVRGRSLELPHSSVEQEDLRNDKLRFIDRSRSLSLRCANMSEMEDHHSDTRPISTEHASSMYDVQEKLDSANSKMYEPFETKETPEVCSCVKLGNLDTKEQISFGMAYFQEKFYVICLESSTILAYKSSSPFHLEQELTIEELKNPHDIAASLTSLYITDSSNCQIWKIDADHKSCLWMEEVGEPHTVSVTPNQEVLLVCSGTHSAASSVKFFASDATLRRSFSLPSWISKPTHAVAIPDDHFIISHGGVGSHKQEICELSADGKVIRTFQSDCRNLSWPCHLAIDCIRGLVFVADFWTKRVLTLNSKFHPVAEMPRDSDSPWRLCYVPELQQLLVGADSSVEVYDVLCKASAVD